jgi:dTDP-glucose 4,6-dehydratase
MIFVTGGAGFIGSNFVLDWLAQSDEPVLNYDKLTYAGNLNNLAAEERRSPHFRARRYLRPGPGAGAVPAAQAARRGALRGRKPRGPFHPRSGRIHQHQHQRHLQPAGSARAYWSGLPEDEKAAFRFLHVSTDEVYGTLGPDDAPFSETTAFAPNSPYSASRRRPTTWCAPTSTPTACRC